MKNAIFRIALLTLPLASLSQTYYYIDNIAVTPQNATSLDNIYIAAFGSFTNTGTQMDSATVTITGYEIYLNYYLQTSLTSSSAEVPHDEYFNLGTLPEGEYHINFVGDHIGDFVSDTTQKHFTVGSLGFDEHKLHPQDKHLLKICDYLGREVQITPNTPLIYYYSNGSIERVMHND